MTGSSSRGYAIDVGLTEKTSKILATAIDLESSEITCMTPPKILP